MIQAEEPSANLPKSIGGTVYSWLNSASVSGYGGSGFMEAGPNDGQSVTTNWIGTSPELQYSVNFTNPGTYRVWLRGFAETSENVSVNVGLDGASPNPATLGVPRFNTWTWTNSGSGSATPVTITVPSAGTHTFNVWMNDAGFRLDRIILTQNPNYTPDLSADFWRDQNIYQVVTDRFFNGVPSNDSLSPNFNPSNGGQAHGGDFNGLEQKLDYIKALGATAVWISPVLLNGNGDYHGYAATDFYKTDPRMGSLSELQSFVRAAHRRGILVVNDVVVNHGGNLVDSTQSGFPNFLAPPAGYTLRHNSSKRYAAPFDNAALGVTLETLFHNNGGTQNWGDATQVELGELASLDDFRTESTYVRDHMAGIFSYWINTVGFDAFRVDTVKHVEMDFWDNWSPRIRSAAAAADKPNFFQFGEVYDGSDAKCGSYTGEKSTANYKMESVLDYPLYYQVNSVFATATGNTKQIEDRYNNITTANYDSSALMSLVTFLDNHDQPRFLNAGGGTSRLNVALAFLYTARGIPCLYYGTEQDFDGGADPGNREDMFDGQFEAGPSLGDNFNMTSPRFKLVAKLNNLRRLYPSLRTGAHANLWNNPSGPGLFAYARRLDTEEVYVVLNTATSPQTIAARPTIHPVGTVVANVLNPAETQTVSATGEIPSFAVPANSFVIYVAQSQLRALDPVVETISPVHDSASVPTNSTITHTFSTAMNTASAQAAFSTSPATTGSFAWSSGNTVLTYMPAGLAGNTLYTVRVAETASNSSGTPMLGAFESRFTTAASSGASPPAVTSSSGSATGDTTASLSASVNPNGASTTVVFQYGQTSGYGSASSGQNIGSGTASVPAVANLAGLTAGATYHYRVAATNSQGTTYGQDATFTTTSTVPETTATTTPATFITAGSANLNGTVNPNGTPTSVTFLYGLQPNVLSMSTPLQDAGSGSTNVDFYAPVNGFSPGTTYYFAVQATSPSKTIQGALQSFTTASIVPSVTTLPAINPTTEGATLKATVNPNGFTTTVFFQYGSTTGYGSATTPVDAGSGNGDAVFATNVSGLTPGQVYNFRAVAVNANGTVYGHNLTFSTGNPPPTVQTKSATGVAAPNATLAATINPNGRATGYWFEYGTSTAYGSNTRQGASDGAESYSSFSYSSPNNNGGSGFDAFVGYTSTSSSRGGIRLVTATSSNGTAGRFIDGAKSFSAYAGSSTTRGTHSGYRPITNPRQFGTFTCSMRFDLDNSKGFAGMNLKSANGTTFGANELLSMGMIPASGSLGGNNGILLTDAAGQRMVDLGAEVRGSIIDFKIDFDTRSGAYSLGVKFRTSPNFITTTGTLRLAGPTVNFANLGYINGNNSGASNQNLIFDSLAITSEGSAGNGTAPVDVASAIGGLAGNTVYHYRAVASSTVGEAAGQDMIFVTGADLAISKTHTGTFTRNSTGQFTISLTNTGSVATSGTVTVSEAAPAGMMVTNMTGTGWSYNITNKTCTRSDVLAAGASYPPITVSAAFASDAAANLTNTATVAGGGDANTANNSASDSFALAPILTPIEAWRQQYFGSPDDSGNGADLFDASGDGLPNLIKYALGLDPTKTAVSGLPSASTANGFLNLTFIRRKDAVDITYRVEATGDLGTTWSEVYSSASTAYEGGGDATHSVTVSDTVPISVAPGGRRFMRLKITRP
jgi:glycosidase